MKKLSVLLILIISSWPEGFAQRFNPGDYDDYIWRRFDITVHNASDLFDSCEIQERKIKSAALLQVYESTGAADTLYIYYFDSSGKAISQVCFTAPSPDVQGDSFVRDKVCDLNTFISGAKGSSGNDRYFVINYTPYGAERKSYNISSDEMIDSELIITCNFGDGYLQTNGRSEMIAYHMEEGSRLISRIVSIQIDEEYYTTHYLIKYL